MYKTFDGRTIGKSYRYLTAETRKLLRVPATIAIFTMLVAPWVLSMTGLHILTQITIMSVVFYCCLVRYNAIRYMAQDDNSRSFQKYVIIRDSVDDWGRNSTLVRWVNDGSHDWLAPNRSTSFRFITE